MKKPLRYESLIGKLSDPFGDQALRVLLINSNRRRDLFAAPPVGLCYVANAAESAGHSVRVLDLCFQRRVRQDVEKEISDFSPDVIGVSVRNIDNVNMLYPVTYLPEIREIIGFVRRISAAPVVIGGSGVSMLPGQVLEMLGADFTVVSDGERSFVELLECLENGRSPDRVPGVGMMIDGRFHLTPPALTDFPSGNPRVGKWTDMRPYTKLGAGYPIQGKRGCSRRCIYCLYAARLEGNRLRLRSPTDVVDEIEEAVLKYGTLSFEFVDSVFNEPADHAREIMEEILKRPWKASFSATSLTPKNLDGDFLDLMWRAGFRSFSISPESASETMIENYRKGFSIDDLHGAVQAVNRTRFTVMWFFMIGGPGETNDTLQETLDFCTKYLRRESPPPLHVANLMVGVRLYPGSRLWEQALDEGFVTETSDPLIQLWYLSRELDLPRAVRQMIDAALLCPELIAGYDERYMVLSNLVAFLSRVFRPGKPYWSITRQANRFLRRPGLLVSFRPHKVVALLEEQLKRQG